MRRVMDVFYVKDVVYFGGYWEGGMEGDEKLLRRKMMGIGIKMMVVGMRGRDLENIEKVRWYEFVIEGKSSKNLEWFLVLCLGFIIRLLMDL